MILSSNEKGFTLIEALIAITVFAIGITGATQLFQNTMTADYNNYMLDQANRLLTSFSEETNLEDINALPNRLQGQPQTPSDLRTIINTDFDDDTYVVKQSENKIKLYRIIASQSLDASNTPQLKTVLLCAAWQTRGYKAPRMIFRTVVKPIASDS